MPTGVGVYELTVLQVNAPYSIGDFQSPIPNITGSGYVTGAVELTVLTIEATGTRRHWGAELKLSELAITGSGRLHPIANSDITLPLLSVLGGRGVQGRSALSLPILLINEVTPMGFGSYDLPLILLEGSGRAIPVTEIFKGIVTNLSNEAISTYSNFPFNSLAYFNKNYMGATSTGIHVLGGDTDNGMYIISKAKTGPQDFGEAFIKRLRETWLSYRSDGYIYLVVWVDEKDTGYERRTEIPGGELIHKERIKLPRGIKGTYYAFEMRNANGSDFDIAGLHVMVEAITRRSR